MAHDVVFSRFMSEEADRPKELIQEILFTDIVSNYQEGRDELNLAEFPISAIGNRLDPSVKTIVFQDTAFDKSTNETITRKLTITASDQYGLPTAPDDEILLGLLQLSRLERFESPTVSFTPYQLLRILGWGINTNNYRRLKDSINRWLGVTLYYENAWRDKKTKQWIDASFHFLDQVEFYKPGKEGVIAATGRSVFKWNDLVFRNFKEGNLKALDFHLYRALEGGIAKRLFRFLDKRFYMRNQLTFDLEAFACEKIGLTRPVKLSPLGRPTVDIAQIKRRLQTAINELESIQYIKTLPVSERFTKSSVGNWEVHFERKPPTQESESPLEPIEIEEITPLEGRLVGHGVTRSQSAKLVTQYDESRVEMQLDALEFLLLRGGDAVPSNRGGWLVKAITENYSLPRGFKSRAQLASEIQLNEEKKKAKKEAVARKKTAELDREDQEAALWKQRRIRICEYRESLTPEENCKLETSALMASPLGRGQISTKLRQTIVEAYILGILGESLDL